MSMRQFCCTVKPCNNCGLNPQMLIFLVKYHKVVSTVVSGIPFVLFPTVKHISHTYRTFLSDQLNPIQKWTTQNFTCQNLFSENEKLLKDITVGSK